MSEINVSVRLFGAFRTYGETVKLAVREGSCAGAVKEALGKVLGDQAVPLIGDSVLADDETILPADYVVEKDMRLSILPPVCGG